MRGYTHVAFATFVALIFIAVFKQPDAYFFVSVAFIASLLPDIDIATSFAGRRAKFIGKIFEHRGFFHTIYAAILFSVVSWKIINQSAGLAVFIGYTSHIALDSMTKAGVKPFAPASKLTFRGHAITGGMFDTLLLGTFIVADIFLFVKVI